MTSPETKPIPLLLAEELDREWLADRALEISHWKDSPYKQWYQASHELDYAINEQSGARMDGAFEDFSELLTHSDYDITKLPFRGAKITLAYERAFRQRLEPDPMGHKEMNPTYRNVVAVAQEIKKAEFLDASDYQLSALSELILQATQMRTKRARSFPYVALPREGNFKGQSFTNHDCYLLCYRGRNLSKDAIDVKLHRESVKGTHPDVNEVCVLEVVSGVLYQFPEVVQKFRSLRITTSIKLAQLNIVADLLDQDTRNELAGTDSRILTEITRGLASRINRRRRTTTSKGAASAEGSMAEQLRQKFNL